MSNDTSTHPHHPGSDTAATNDWTVREGTPVITFDGEKIGEVDNATGGYLLVKKGFLFPKEYSIPAAAIENVGPDAVYLSVTKEIALAQGWDAPLTPETPEQALPTTPTADAPPQVVTGDPHVDAPLIGTFTDHQAGTYVDEASGTQTVSSIETIAPAEPWRDRDDALLDTETATATAPAGVGVDAEEIPANPIVTDAVPAATSTDQEIPMSAFESDASNARDAALASHDEVLAEGVDAPHSLRTPDPLPVMDAPDSADDPLPADGASDDVVTQAELENDALDPLISEDAEADPEPELPAPSGPTPTSTDRA